LMKRVGFVKADKVIASTRPDSHGSFVFVWTLVDRSKAESFLSRCRTMLVSQGKNEEQTLLAM